MVDSYDENDNLFECDEDDDYWGSDIEEDDPGEDINPSDAENDRLTVKHIRTEDVVREMDVEIEKARTVIQRSYTSTRLLLSAYNWDAQKCIDHYFANQLTQSGSDADKNPDSPEATKAEKTLFGFQVAQSPQTNFLFNYNHETSVQSPLPQEMCEELTESGEAEKVTAKECLICLSDISLCHVQSACSYCYPPSIPDQDLPNSVPPFCPTAGVIRVRGCLHMFCSECVIKYLEEKISSVGKADRVLCPDEYCKNVIDDSLIIQLLEGKAKAIQQYKQLMANNYVQKNRLMRWCSSPECTYALKAEEDLMKKAECICGKVICFKCGRDWHDPLQCHLLDKWMLKYTTDSENAHYIVAHTKPCPKCKVSIEKNGGCNHMTCKTCSHHFCWICMDDWNKHGQNWYNCTRFQEDQGATEQINITRQRLKRFVHYGGRYDAHTSSIRKIPQLKELVQEKVQSMTNDCRLSYVDTKFLTSAVTALEECRAVLAYTYAFAYYLSTNNQKHILEDNQKDLELVTEDLTAHLERDLADDPFRDADDCKQFKIKVQDYTSYCNSRSEKLLQHVKEGYDFQLWEYDQSLITERVLPR
ncbi:E3 ubiquitin-protein ligase ariadne-1-like [Convolutriloba macropyga]|uniref:E3 ubiquitin-protein ligase ariadne-1-like n=1 Tax=Convolutriloba macropyga TaxID=536237 RepID=UPI003F525278